MPFYSAAYLNSLSEKAGQEVVLTQTLLGYHPETQDSFLIPDIDRYAGTYVLGVQGVGKSSLLENMIYWDICAKNTAVIIIDPHGDLVDHVIGQVQADSETDCNRMFLFDMLDENYPFGVNVFSGKKYQSTISQTQAVDRVMHIFEVLWGDLLSQQNLPRYLRAATITLLSNPSTTLVDMYDFLLNDSLREKMLRNVSDSTITQFWEYQYNSKSPSVRVREVAPLLSRLETLFMGRSLVRNIIGQSATTIDFRKAIENKEILLIKLPLKTLPQDARLIGTMLIAQIHAAIFSFANLPQVQRPGFSLFVDEFQHFATTDFSEMFTEGRKFGARVTLAHQFRDQIPDTLKSVRSAMLTARTKACFQTTPEDAREMTRVFETPESTKGEETIEIDPKPVEYLITYGHDHPQVRTFIDVYLRPMRSQRKGGRIEITDYFAGYGTELLANLMGYTTQRYKPTVADPEPYLNNLLYQCMKNDDIDIPIPYEVVLGFSNCGKQFFKEWDTSSKKDKAWLCSKDIRFPLDLVVETPEHTLRWTRQPKNGEEQLFHFLFHLHRAIFILSGNPIGKRTRTTKTTADIAQMLNSLPRRAAFIRSGEDVATIFTEDTPEMVSPATLRQRVERIKAATRQKYCKPRSEVERDMQARSGVILDEEAVAQVEPMKVLEPETKLPEPAVQRELETPAELPVSLDMMNSLYGQVKVKEIDPDTTFLAALGEHYVLTIKQWMRLFTWGSYPRATQYFKELKDNDMIYRKDREGRGGKLVEGDWFFLLTKGANELLRRRQASPLFRLEPNEAEKASGDTLFHTSLVNEVLIHLRLLERAQPDTIRIEQIDHERNMRRTYLAALADSKLYPDGFLRLLVPTPNGLKRRHMFLELQHTTQRDKHNWQTKVRKYIDLFDQASLLEQFFATRTPQVLVLTMDTEYIAYHKQWTEEVLAERGDRGRAYSNRFLIGVYDTGISDMTLLPEQYFCTPRFSTPFQSTPRSVFGT